MVNNGQIWKRDVWLLNGGFSEGRGEMLRGMNKVKLGRPSVIGKDAEMDERRGIRLQWERETIRERQGFGDDEWRVAGFDGRGRQSDKLRLMSSGKLLQCWISTWADRWQERRYASERGDAETDEWRKNGLKERGRPSDRGNKLRLTSNGKLGIGSSVERDRGDEWAKGSQSSQPPLPLHVHVIICCDHVESST